jgi:ubiquitin-conjugating enzyme E2 T
MALQNRMARELRSLEAEPPEGVSAWPVANSITNLKAQIQGPPNTVYEDALFELQITIPERSGTFSFALVRISRASSLMKEAYRCYRYPFEPPSVVFVTPVYHPNIDSSGRICLDMLKPKPSVSRRAGPLNAVTLLHSTSSLEHKSLLHKQVEVSSLDCSVGTTVGYPAEVGLNKSM